MNEQEKFKKERQQPSQKLGHYTLGARCECGHTYQKHQLGVCIHCECKEFRYVRHPLTSQAKAQLKAIVPFKEKIIEGFTIKMYPITSDKKLSYSKVRQLLEKLDECGTFLLGRKEGMKDAIRNELVFLQSIDKLQKFHTPQYCAICQRMIKLRKVMEQ